EQAPPFLEGTVRLNRVLWLAVVIVLVGVSSVRAQEASVIGTVADETKALLPGVTVTLTELSTGNQYTSVSNEKGEYRLPTFPPGTYKISAELPGFSTVVVDRIELLVGQHAAMPFTMKLAAVTETVTVSGA